MPRRVKDFNDHSARRAGALLVKFEYFKGSTDATISVLWVIYTEPIGHMPNQTKRTTANTHCYPGHRGFRVIFGLHWRFSFTHGRHTGNILRGMRFQ